MNGKVTFLRRVNLGNYEHKEASAEISFSVEDDADYIVQKGIVDKSMDQAVEVVESRLGLVKAVPDPQQGHSTKAAAGAALAWAEAKTEPLKAKKEPEPKVNGLGEKFINGEVDADGDPITKMVVDDFVIEDYVKAKNGADTLADLDAELADIPREVTNDELHSVCRAYVIKHEQPGKVALQRLLAGYATQIAAIPQARRLDFLRAMETLTP